MYQSEHLRKRRIDQLTNGFGVISHALKHKFNVRLKIMLKARHQRSILNLSETPELF